MKGFDARFVEQYRARRAAQSSGEPAPAVEALAPAVEAPKYYRANSISPCVIFLAFAFLVA